MWECESYFNFCGLTVLSLVFANILAIILEVRKFLLAEGWKLSFTLRNTRFSVFHIIYTSSWIYLTVACR